MYEPCPLCNKKKAHWHKGCNEDNALRVEFIPKKKK